MALAAAGNLTGLEWARRNAVSWSATTATAAAANGHYGVLRWALDNGCEAESITVRAAAASEGGGEAALHCLAMHPAVSQLVRELATAELLERRTLEPASAVAAVYNVHSSTALLSI